MKPKFGLMYTAHDFTYRLRCKRGPRIGEHGRRVVTFDMEIRFPSDDQWQPPRLHCTLLVPPSVFIDYPKHEIRAFIMEQMKASFIRDLEHYNASRLLGNGKDAISRALAA